MTNKTSFNIPDWLKSPGGIGLIVFLAIVAFYLIVEHNAHVFGFLPYALLLLCPILHVLMHRGHGGHEEQADVEKSTPHEHNSLPRQGGSS